MLFGIARCMQPAVIFCDEIDLILNKVTLLKNPCLMPVIIKSNATYKSVSLNNTAKKMLSFEF